MAEPHSYEKQGPFIRSAKVQITVPTIAAPADVAVEPAAQPAVQIPEYLNESFRELGVSVANVASGNTGALLGQLSMAKGNIEAAIAKAQHLGIPTTGISTQDIDSLLAAGNTVNPSELSMMIENAMKAVSEGEKLVAQVNMSELAQVAGAGIASVALFSSGVFNDSVAALNTGNMEGIKHRMDEIVGSAKGILANLNFLQTGADGALLKFEPDAKQMAPIDKEPLIRHVAVAQLMEFSPPTAGLQQAVKGLGLGSHS